VSESIKPMFWNKKKQRAIENRSFPEYPEFNQRLNVVENFMRAEYRRLELEAGVNPPSATTLKKVIDHKLHPQKAKSLEKGDFMRFFKKIIDDTNAGVRMNHRTGHANRPPRMLEGHFRTVKAFSFQNNDDVLVSGDEGGLILFFCPMEDSVTDFVVNVDQEITTLTWSPNDRFVLAGTAAGDIILLNCPIKPKHGLRATQN